MTTMFEREVTCSQCGVKSRQTVIGSTNAMGSPDLDLRPPEMQRSTMFAWTQLCPTCGLVADDLSESNGDVSAVLHSESYRRILADIALPTLTARFWCAALLDAAMGQHRNAFQAMLCAAWAADDANAGEVARDCRRLAVDHMMRDPVTEPEARLRLLDVVRRAGLWKKAAGLAADLGRVAERPELKKIIAFQEEAIAAKDDRCYKVSDVLR